MLLSYAMSILSSVVISAGSVNMGRAPFAKVTCSVLAVPITLIAYVEPPTYGERVH